MSSDPLCTFRIVRVPKIKASKRVDTLTTDSSSEPKVSRYCIGAEMPAFTMAYLKRNTPECPVEAPTVSEVKFPIANPIYANLVNFEVYLKVPVS